MSTTETVPVEVSQEAVACAFTSIPVAVPSVSLTGTGTGTKDATNTHHSGAHPLSGSLSRTIMVWCPDWPVRAALMQHPEFAVEAPIDSAVGFVSGSTPEGTSDAPGKPDISSPATSVERGEAPVVALIDKGIVFACSSAARREGIRRGLGVREAQARFPGLVVLPYDATLDARLFEPLCEAARAVSPGVQLIRPGLIALRARGPARFYGSERTAAAKLLGTFETHGVPDARIGIADGLFAAELAAKLARSGYVTESPDSVSEPSSLPGSEITPLDATYQCDLLGDPSGVGELRERSDSHAPDSSPEAIRARVTIIAPGGSPAFLAGMPVETMGDASFTDLCHRLGLHTLGRLATLDETTLSARFGALGARVHALVTGHDLQAVVPSESTLRLERAITFDEPLGLAEQVAFAVRQSAEELVMAASSQHLIITAVTVTIEAEKNAVDRSWLHPRNFTAADIVDRVRWQLQGTVTGAVTRVTLSVANVDAAHRHEEGLWGGSSDERVHHALSRVQSMLGHEAVVTACIGGGRMPGQRRLLIPWGDRAPTVSQSRLDQPWPGTLPGSQPSAVFTPRLPVAVTGSDSATITVTERGMLSAAPQNFVPRGGQAFGGHLSSGQTSPQPTLLTPSTPSALRRVLNPTDSSPVDLASLCAWAGPWPLDEHWWDAATARKLYRFVIVDAQGTAWLLVTDGAGHWEAEGRYD